MDAHVRRITAFTCRYLHISASASQASDGKQLRLRRAPKPVHLDEALVGFFFFF